ncbi:hypothetical protein [Nocardiopsis ansamitocini]|uniref:Secreted protein n=1 Tax=Nocardiopsis ansamitocini TaxID=1670832 RepID=A0A9W6P576_9ACTN|nr:hypothetical protein [Nocardiopsis ansamitocini]GLU47430.1 hypothetical protein Nans01_17810 [Nocardiopsis ansamitocini]
MRLRSTAVALVAAAAIGGTLASAAPANAATGSFAVHSLPGYEEVKGGSGCYALDSRIVTLAKASNNGEYLLYGGPDCTGQVLGFGFDETQWIPPLIGVRSARVTFPG